MENINQPSNKPSPEEIARRIATRVIRFNKEVESHFDLTKPFNKYKYIGTIKLSRYKQFNTITCIVDDKILLAQGFNYEHFMLVSTRMAREISKKLKEGQEITIMNKWTHSELYFSAILHEQDITESRINIARQRRSTNEHESHPTLSETIRMAIEYLENGEITFKVPVPIVSKVPKEKRKYEDGQDRSARENAPMIEYTFDHGKTPKKELSNKELHEGLINLANLEPPEEPQAKRGRKSNVNLDSAELFTDI